MTEKIKKTLLTIAIALVAAGILASCISGTYNNMIGMDEQVSAKWAEVENQYQRRFDLIPNLVSTVKGYATHENEVFTQIAQARAMAGGVTKIDSDIIENAEKFAEFQKAQDSLGSALKRLLVITENYPQLKANDNFLALQDELEGTENRIAVARKNYNEAAQSFNTTIRKFPAVFLANSFGFKTKSYFTATVQAQTAPEVKF